MARFHLTYSTGLVLKAIESGLRYGFDIMDVTGLPSGTVYPALRRLEKQGFVTSRWEKERDAHEQQRPQRRNYSLTRGGRGALHEALRRFKALEQVHLEPEAGATQTRSVEG